MDKNTDKHSTNATSSAKDDCPNLRRQLETELMVERTEAEITLESLLRSESFEANSEAVKIGKMSEEDLEQENKLRMDLERLSLELVSKVREVEECVKMIHPDGESEEQTPTDSDLPVYNEAKSSKSEKSKKSIEQKSALLKEFRILRYSADGGRTKDDPSIIEVNECGGLLNNKRMLRRLRKTIRTGMAEEQTQKVETVSVVLNSCHESLRKLTLKDLDIKEIHENFFSNNYLSNLFELSLRNNDLKKLPLSICCLEKLSILDVSKNKLSTLPADMYKLKKIRKLNLSNNCFREVPSCLQLGLPLITHLNLSKNEISNFDWSPFCISKIISLDLSHNKTLISSPSWIWSYMCSSLCSLNLEKTNSFASGLSPRVLHDIKNSNYKTVTSTLQKLDVSESHLSIDSSVFLEILKGLNSLAAGNDRLSHDCQIKNSFYRIPSSIMSLGSHLIDLRMPSVGLISLPDDIDKFKTIRKMDFSYNSLTSLPESFGMLKTLTSCVLSHNAISVIPDTICNCEKLCHLSLDNNEISVLPSSMEKLTSLEYLDLYGNVLREIPNSLLKLSGIALLDLGYNYINFDVEETSEEVKIFLETYDNKQKFLRATLKGVVDRSSVMKPPTPEIEEEEETDDSLSESSDMEMESIEKEPPHVIIENEEVWESGSDTHDDFVPSSVRSESGMRGFNNLNTTFEVLDPVIPWSLALSDHKYLPSQYHQSSILKDASPTTQQQLNSIIDKDQFEDIES